MRIVCETRSEVNEEARYSEPSGGSGQNPNVSTDGLCTPYTEPNQYCECQYCACQKRKSRILFDEQRNHQ